MTILKKITAAILLLSLVLSCAACAGSAEETVPGTEPAQTTEEQTPAQTTAPEVTIPAPKPDVAIETPYATMYFPGDWAGFLRTSTDEGALYTVNFICRLESGREQPLFSISFGETVTEPIGAVKAPDGKLVNVSAVSEDFTPDDTWSDSEINIVYNLMDCMNDVLESLSLQEAVTQQPAETKPAETNPGETKPAETRPGSSETLPPEMQGDMAIDTPYGELHYPVKWADYLSIQVSEDNGYSVAFYCALDGHEDAHLFTVHFGGTQGSVVTTINSKTGGTVEVRVSLTELNLDESWIDNDVGIAYSMQEDINYLLAAIME